MLVVVCLKRKEKKSDIEFENNNINDHDDVEEKPYERKLVEDALEDMMDYWWDINEEISHMVIDLGDGVGDSELEEKKERYEEKVNKLEEMMKHIEDVYRETYGTEYEYMTEEERDLVR